MPRNSQFPPQKTRTSLRNARGPIRRVYVPSESTERYAVPKGRRKGGYPKGRSETGPTPSTTSSPNLSRSRSQAVDEGDHGDTDTFRKGNAPLTVLKGGTRNRTAAEEGSVAGKSPPKSERFAGQRSAFVDLSNLTPDDDSHNNGKRDKENTNFVLTGSEDSMTVASLLSRGKGLPSSLLNSIAHDMNRLKEQLATEKKLKQTLDQLSQSQLREIERLNKEVRELKREREIAKMRSSGTGFNEEDDGISNKRGKKRRRKDSLSIPKKEQTPLWVYVSNRMRVLCFTKVYCKKKLPDGRYIQDWDPVSVAFEPHDTENTEEMESLVEGTREDFGSSILTLSDGRVGVPKCPMERALKEGFLSTPLTPKSFEREILAAYDSEKKLREFYPEYEEYKNIAKEVSDAKYRDFRQKVGNAISSKKKEAVDGLLRSLGWPVLNDINKKACDYKTKRSEAESGVLCAIELLLRTEKDASGSEWPVFGVYRSSEFNLISNPKVYVEEPDPPEVVRSQGDDIIDILFANNAARSAYCSWTRCTGEDRCSVLELAKLDAWISTWLELTRDFLLNKEDQKAGGYRNKKFNVRFFQLLPRALGAILLLCRDEVQKRSPVELRKPFNYEERMKCVEQGDVSKYDDHADMELEVEPEVHNGDIFNRNGRKYTKAFNHPNNRFDYVALSPEFFKSHICSWMGDIIDCYVGKCHSHEMSYEPIDANEVAAWSQWSIVEEENGS